MKLKEGLIELNLLIFKVLIMFKKCAVYKGKKRKIKIEFEIISLFSLYYIESCSYFFMIKNKNLDITFFKINYA